MDTNTASLTQDIVQHVYILPYENTVGGRSSLDIKGSIFAPQALASCTYLNVIDQGQWLQPQSQSFKRFVAPAKRPLTQVTMLTICTSQRVYALLLQIPPGRISSYAAMAKALNSSPRAVGGALRRNPFAPEVVSPSFPAQYHTTLANLPSPVTAA